VDNKEKILKCALKLFSRRGYYNVGIQEIVDGAGITKPTLYYYFQSKEGLLKAILDEYFDAFNSKITSTASYEKNLLMSLRNTAFAFFEFAKENTGFYRMLLSMEYDPPESVSRKMIMPYLEVQFKIIEELFLKASKDHGNMKGRHMLYAVSFIGLLNTYITLVMNNQISLNDDTVYKIVHHFMHGIFS
jgi:AcrR family transcriptional regulator